MNIIYQTTYGSHLYGTATETSDNDQKAIFIPDAKDILLQRAKSAINDSQKKEVGELDIEYWSLQKFLKLCAEGQAGALEVLFSIPRPLNLAQLSAFNPIFVDLYNNKNKFLNKKAHAFVGYCRQQASRYGVRGDRVKALKEILSTLNNLDPKSKLIDHLEVLDFAVFFSNNKEHISLYEKHFDNGGSVWHLEVCQKAIPCTSFVKSAIDMYQKKLDEYGKRSLEAETAEGIDWKAMAHAVRIAEEAIEFLSTGYITLPRPNAQELLDIRQGKRDIGEVNKLIDDLLVEVERAVDSSQLPEEADYEWIDNFVSKVYGLEVKRYLANERWIF